MKIAGIDEIICDRDFYSPTEYVFYAKSSRLILAGRGHLFDDRCMAIYLKNNIYSIDEYLIEYSICQNTNVIFSVKERYDDTTCLTRPHVLIPAVRSLEELKIWIDLNEQ